MEDAVSRVPSFESRAPSATLWTIARFGARLHTPGRRFISLQASLAALILVSLWSVFTDGQTQNYTGFVDDDDDDDEDWDDDEDEPVPS